MLKDGGTSDPELSGRVQSAMSGFCRLPFGDTRTRRGRHGPTSHGWRDRYCETDVDSAWRQTVNTASIGEVMNPDLERMAEIEREIASDQSPVGIDAKKTHVMILLILERIEAGLQRIESSVAGTST